MLKLSALFGHLAGLLCGTVRLLATAQVFADRTLVSKVDNYGQYAELELASGADPQQILQRLVTSGARLSKFELQEASLNKIFIDLVGPEAARA